MPMIMLIIIGIAAGFLATRVMNVQADLPTTIVIGIAGALAGGFLLRMLLVMTTFAAGLVGAVLGAVAVIWLYQKYIER
ncbi:GlsB/YeaQ/YmgE family stress response membrane protein [Cypionkella sp.]|uniref:GlsB/YeaQ/YmgE family stress response membrane protein n=1 Tax=Cypionkella sp. TaxID=2811411 RepID=UPI003753BE95